MRVLHVIPAVAPRYGGPSQSLEDLCRGLRGQGVEVLVVCTDADGPRRLAVPLGRSVCRDGIPHRFFPRQWSEAWKYSRPLARWLPGGVRGFDLVHVHGVFSHACLAAAEAARCAGLPWVVRPLGALDPYAMAQKPLRKRIFWALAGRRMLGGAAAVHYSTDTERELVEGSLGLGRGVVVPLAVAPPPPRDAAAEHRFRAAHGLDAEQPYVLVLSRLHPIKGLELLVDAFLEVTASAALRRWRLVLAGAGDADYVRALGARAAARGAAQRVLFSGWLSGAAKHAALHGAALAALPSRHENFGLAVAEAMSHGLPVLVSDQVFLAAEVRRHAAGWVVPREPGAMGRALEAALADAAARRRRGAAGRGFARRALRPEVVAAALRDLYREILVQPPVPLARAAGRDGGTVS